MKNKCDIKNCNELAKITWIGSTDRKLHHYCINHFNEIWNINKRR